ncbi:MAG: VCBS domain-containing protein, partial [Alphaproteobacteria bacterium]|nr:VCBS domain-containing protein [Alphaproteobacteria bacterium]
MTKTNLPTFNPIEPVTIREGSTLDLLDDVVGRFTLNDDSGTFGKVAYSVTLGDMVATTDEVAAGFTHRIDGTYGTFYYNNSTGLYLYAPHHAAINSLAAGVSQTDTFTVTATNSEAQTVSQTFTITVIGENDEPVLRTIPEQTITDTQAVDDFADITGRFIGFDPEHRTVTYSVIGAAADTSESGFTHSLAGTYGKLYYNSHTGAYKYVPDDAAINAIGESSTETESFSVRASDVAGESSIKSLTITITGADDPFILNPIPAQMIIDTAEADDFDDITGHFTAIDDGSTVTYEVAGAGADTSESGFTHSKTGTYGTLYYNSGTG